jgi:hypothetical protein
MVPATRRSWHNCSDRDVTRSFLQVNLATYVPFVSAQVQNESTSVLRFIMSRPQFLYLSWPHNPELSGSPGERGEYA